MAKTYRTAQGKSLDIERLRLQNEFVPAIGNMRVNARGDQLGPGGRVVKSREDMVNEYYQNNLSSKSTKAKLNTAEPDIIPTKGGKSKRVETFEPGNIEIDDFVETTVAEPEILEDDFEDPIVEPANLEPEVEEVEVQEPVESQVSSVTQQEPVAEETKTKTPATKKTLKGGLARAVAKTREYEEKKNKPKRL